MGERVILAGRDKDVEERNVTMSFNQSPERATATRGRVPLVTNIFSRTPRGTRTTGWEPLVYIISSEMAVRLLAPRTGRALLPETLFFCFWYSFLL
jgi:hypothetical protein